MYACHNWYLHLRAVPAPTCDLLDQAEDFLTGFEFVTWSENLSQLGDNQDLSATINTYNLLKAWFSSSVLPDAMIETRPDGYFDMPYRYLMKFYNNDGGDKILPLLCRARLGQYWSLSGELDRAHGLLRDVAKGFRNLLGKRNPLEADMQIIENCYG